MTSVNCDLDLYLQGQNDITFFFVASYYAIIVVEMLLIKLVQIWLHLLESGDSSVVTCWTADQEAVGSNATTEIKCMSL